VSGDGTRLTRLRSTLPRNRREYLAVAVAFGPSLGVTLLVEELSNRLLPLIPAWLIFALGGSLISIRWLRRHDPPPAPAGAADRQPLPPQVKPLVGREGEVKETVTLARERGLVVLRGVAGIGTSAVAVAAGWELGPRPGLQRYADLRGQDWQHPENALSVARRVLRTLGRPSGQVESTRVAAREVSAALRDSGQVLLLDNVERWSQVAWLPRHVPGAWMIVAGEVEEGSREPVPTDVAVVPVGPLTPANGMDLLRGQISAERMDSDPASTRRLADSFLTRPALAVGIGRWLAENPRVTVATLAADLEREPHDHALRVLLDKLLRRVSPGARRLLTLLAHVPIAELGIEAAVALAARPEHDVQRAMDDLGRHCLVEKVRESRIRVVDAARAVVTPPPDGEAAWRRLVEYFADRAGFFAEGLPLPEARRWFEIEDKALLQVLKVEPPGSWAVRPLRRIADALDAWFVLEQRQSDRREAARALARAAARLGDADAQASADLRLCVIALTQGEPGTARAHLNAIRSRLRGDVTSWPAQLHLVHAATLLAGGDEFESVEAELLRYGQALPGGDQEGQATDLINRAVLRVRRGQGLASAGEIGAATEAYRDARSLLIGALGVASDAGDANAEAHAREVLGLAHWYLGWANDAGKDWRRAAELYERSGDVIGRARCRVHEATALLNGAEPDRLRAAELLRDAVDRLPPTGLGTALAHLHLARADPRDAAAHREAGLAALAPWDGLAEPAQVTEVRRRLTDLPDC
jgi:tetratricopeptide (TPR) repeat protein